MGIVQEKLPSRQQFNGLHRQLLNLTLMEVILEKECFFCIEKMGGDWAGVTIVVGGGIGGFGVTVTILFDSTTR